MAKSDNGDINNRLQTSDNNDPNNSFMKKVTSKVSSILPTSLSKWFGESGRTHPVIRRRDESQDDDDNEQQNDTTDYVTQPPRKRARNTETLPILPIESSFITNNFQMTSTPIVNNNNNNSHIYTQPGPSGYVKPQEQLSRDQPDRQDHQEDRQFQQNDRENQDRQSQPDDLIMNVPNNHGHIETDVHINGDDRSDSGESTSGYSSVPVHNAQKESSLTSDKDSNKQDMNTSKILNVKSPVTPTRSLFSEQSLTPQRSCMSSRRPSFNTSTFGSPSFIDRTLSTNRAMNSPFYSGKTMFGGSASASSLKRSRTIFPVDDAKRLAVRNSVQIKPINESTKTDHNHLSKTAKRILDVLETFSTPVMDARKIPSVAEARREEAKKSKNKPPVKGLMIPGAPGVPDLLRMKLREKLQDSTVAVRNVASTSKSALNTNYTLPVDNVDKTKPTGKIKNKITSTRDRNTTDNETVPQLVLPEVQLPISTLPKFDFSLPPPTTKPPPTSKNEFKFSSPISINDPPKNVISINNFKFSQPITDSEPPTPVQFNYTPSVSTLKKKEVPKNNGQNSTIQPAEKLVTGSVMDVLGNKTDKSDDLMEKFKPASGTWECSSCMVRNIPTATRCVACETLREQPKPTAPLPSFGTQFRIPTDKWECTVCMVRNDNNETKCVACTTPKTGQPPEPKPTGFGNQFKPPTDTWECNTCMIRNQTSSTKCVACETPKPGTSQKSTLTMPPETKTASGFLDIIQKQHERWECKTCLIRNPMDKTVCMSCDTIRVGAPQPPQTQFKFGIPSKQDAPKTGYKFGIDFSKQTTGHKFGINVTPNTDTSSGFKFGIEANTSKNTSSGVKFGVDINPSKTHADGSSSGFKFGINVNTNKINTDNGGFGVVSPKSGNPTETIEIRDSDDEKDKKKDVIVIDDDDSDDVKPEMKLKTSPAKTNLQMKSTTSKEHPKESPKGAKSNEKNNLNMFKFGASKTGATPTESKPPTTTPNFNFGGGLPFKLPKTTETTPATTSENKPMFSIGSNSAAVKPFSFGGAISETKSSGDPPKSVGLSSSQPSGSLFKFGKGDAVAAPTPTVFGQPTTSSFSAPTTSTPAAFGGFPGKSITFGVSTPAFGAPAGTSANTSVGIGTSAPTFGGTSKPIDGGLSKPIAGTSAPTPGDTSAPKFSIMTTSTFGGTSTSFGVTTLSTFGGTSTFGGAPAPSFGVTAAPSFGVTTAPSFGSTTAPSFGSTTAPSFGSTTAPSFGSTATPTFGVTSTPTFTGTSTPTFGVTKATPFTVTTASTFGGASTPNYGGNSSTFGGPSSSFGGSSSAYGSAIPTFGTTTSPFGAPTTSSYGASTSSTTTFGAPISSASTFGGSSSFGVTTPQNGGFNFGAAASAAPNFKFGSTNNQPTAVFGFGSSQVNSGGAAPAPSGAFVFGSGNTPASTTPFSPDTKPNFNFTGGSVPSFSAQPGGLQTPAGQPVRKIRKAVRRVQPR